MKTLETALQSRGSCFSDRLVFTSGLYCLVTGADYGDNRWDGTAASAVECGRDNGLCTASKAEAYRLWGEYIEHHDYK